MVRAILDGRKTQTRRVVKPPPDECWTAPIQCERYHPTKVDRRTGETYPGDEVFGFADEESGWVSPYGGPGSRLWVKETFQPLFDIDDAWSVDYKTGKGYRVSYPATDGIAEFYDAEDELSNACKPSILMPRWASRLTLEITAVRVERLQDISEADALAEGIKSFQVGYPRSTGEPYVGYQTEYGVENWIPTNSPKASLAYRRLWTDINGPGSWEKNPWVWVIEFKKP